MPVKTDAVRDAVAVALEHAGVSRADLAADARARLETRSKRSTARQKLEAAAVLERIDAELAAVIPDDDQRMAAIDEELAGQTGGLVPKPVAFNFEAAPDPPEWLVDRLIERGTVAVLSGDTGAAKSIVSSSLIPAALQGDDWLGRSTGIKRVLVVDEENPERLVRARLRALGVENSMRERLHYFSREGVAIGDQGQSDAWLRRELESFRPDLVVVDTLMAACAVEDTNSNSEAVRIMKLLRSLAREFECAVLLLHHERKRSKDHPSSSGQAMMGARQWAGQADAHMTLSVESDFVTEPTDDGGEVTRRTFKFRPAEKDRDGRSNQPRRLAVTSERDTDGRYRWMQVEDEGPLTDEGAQDHMAAAILGSLNRPEGTEPTKAADLAAAVGAKNADDGSFKRALALLVEQGRLERAKRGHYQITASGRESVPLPV